MPAGYCQTGGASGYVVVVGPGGVGSGGTSSNNNFSNYQKASNTYTISLHDALPIFSADDTGLGGVTINLYTGSTATGTPVTAVTAADGSLFVPKLAPSTYIRK